MTLRTKIEAAIAAVFLLCAVLGLRAERKARAAAEAVAKTEQAQIADLAKQRDNLAAGDRARDRAAQQTIAALQKSAAAAQTPAQIIKWLPAQLPKSIPQPVIIHEEPKTLENPAPNFQATIPQADLVPLKNLALDAQTCAAALPVAQQNLSSCKAQLKLAGEQLSAAEKERDAYEQALKGGTFWQRTKSGAKKIAIGVGLGVAVVCGSGHCK